MNNKVNVTDVASIEAKNREFELFHPANVDTKLGIVFELRSSYHNAVKKVRNQVEEELTKKRQKNRNKPVSLSDEQKIRFIGAHIEKFTFKDDVVFEGEKLEYNTVNLNRLLEKDWILDQLDEEIGDTSSFFS